MQLYTSVHRLLCGYMFQFWGSCVYIQPNHWVMWPLSMSSFEELSDVATLLFIFTRDVGGLQFLHIFASSYNLQFLIATLIVEKNGASLWF